jgi:hypothetical protein
MRYHGAFSLVQVKDILLGAMWGVKKLQVIRDLKLVIDWARKKKMAQDTRLEPILRGIKFVFLSFELLSFNHNFRELNKKEDELSKEALLLPTGSFGFYEFLEGVETQSIEFCH